MTTNEKDAYLLTGVEIKMYDPDAVSEETEQEQEEEQLQIEENNLDNESENEEEYQEDDEYTEEEDEQNDEHQASTVIGEAQEADSEDPSNKLDDYLPLSAERKKKKK